MEQHGGNSTLGQINHAFKNTYGGGGEFTYGVRRTRRKPGEDTSDIFIYDNQLNA